MVKRRRSDWSGSKSELDDEVETQFQKSISRLAKNKHRKERDGMVACHCQPAEQRLIMCAEVGAKVVFQGVK